MKKMKKALSLLLVLALACGTCVSAFALDANEATTIDSVGSVVEDLDKVTADPAQEPTGQDTTQGKKSEYATVNKGQLGDKTVEVYVSKGPSYTVMIPKTVILDGQTGIGKYTVAVKGDIEGRKQISVVPYKDAETAIDANNKLELSQPGKTAIKADIVQNGYAVVDAVMSETTYADEAKLEGTITIEADTLTAGSWSGSFLMHISYDDIA